jgi:hypothetical protein
MITVKNPTDLHVSIVINGETYVVGPYLEVVVSDEVAIAWKKVHTFLALMEVSKVKVAEVEPIVLEVEKPIVMKLEVKSKKK